MKNTKLSKIILLALSVAILVGCALAFSVSAAEEKTTDDMIVAQNIVYGDKVAIAYAVNVPVADAANTTVNYYWEGASDVVKKATYLSDTTYTKDGVKYPVFITEGVAAKELAKVAYVTTDGNTYKSYSAAEYLYIRLYEDGFAAKTEADVGEDGKDYNRKLLYQNLLNYGEQAQLVFDYKTDKLLNDYSIAYTTSELINLAGKSYVFGHGAISVEGTVIGEGTIAGWTVTDLVNGGSSESENVVLSLTGAYQVEPIFGVHEHIDENNDHICDNCPEKISDCTTTDGDHICDLCGKIATKCADGNADGKCDTCGAYTFDSTVNTTESIVVSHVQSNTIKATTTSINTPQTSITNADRDTNYPYGTFFSLATDPVDATNSVINIDTNKFDGGGANAPATIVFNTSDSTNAYSVFEADMYIGNGVYVIGSTTRYYFDAVYFHIGGTSSGTKLTWYHSSTKQENSYQLKFAGQILADGYTDSWIKYKVVCDSTNYYAYYSVDGGATYTFIASAKHNAGSVPTSFLIQTNTYGVTYEANLDNVSIKNVNSVSIPLVNGTVETYPAN